MEDHRAASIDDFGFKWVETNVHVYQAISTEHQKFLKVFGSFTNTEKHPMFGRPQIMTEWGFNGSQFPLIKSVRFRENDEEEWQYKFYIGYVI
jgi:hypothetical protein